MLVPGEIVGTVIPSLFVSPESVKKLHSGSPLFSEFLLKDQVLKEGEKVAVFEKERFIGCYAIKHEGDSEGLPEFVLN